MCRRPTNPVLLGRAKKLSLETKAASRAYPLNKVPAVSSAVTSPGCFIDGNGRPYFSRAREKDGVTRSSIILTVRRPRTHGRRVIGCCFGRFFLPARNTTQKDRAPQQNGRRRRSITT